MKSSQGNQRGLTEKSADSAEHSSAEDIVEDFIDNQLTDNALPDQLDLTFSTDPTLDLSTLSTSTPANFEPQIASSAVSKSGMRSWPAIGALALLVFLAMFSVLNLTKSADYNPPEPTTRVPTDVLQTLDQIDQALSQRQQPSTEILTSLRQSILRIADTADALPLAAPLTNTAQVSVSTVAPQKATAASTDSLTVERLLSDLDALELSLASVGPVPTAKSLATALARISNMQLITQNIIAARELLDQSRAEAAARHQQLIARHGRWAILLLGLLVAGLLAMALQQSLAFRRHEQRLIAGDQQLKSAIEGLPDGCVVLNRNREVTAHNERLTKLLPNGSSPDGVVAESLYNQICHDSTVNRDALSDWLENLSADSTSVIELLDHQDRHVMIREKPTGNGLITSTIRDITDSKQISQQLQKASDMDTLTSLPNRTLFMRRLREVIGETDSSTNVSLALIICDLRDFRQINDSYGQATGDQLLIEISGALKQSMPQSAIMARIAGDEFGIIIQPPLDKKAIETATKEFLDRLRQGFTIGNRHIPVHASIGVAYAPEHGLSPIELKNTADSACAQAKRSTSTTFRVFDRQLQMNADRDHMIDIGLTRAIVNDELQIEYQPQIDIQSNLTAGMEALLRWDSPELGKVSPAEFIPRAEKNGMILELGDWVLHKAIRDYQRLSKFVTATGTLSVNLSRRQFENPHLIEDIQKTLADTGMKPDELTLEITETAILDDRDHAKHMLNELHCLGINLSIDDFGVGYSSLLELRDFPINEVKIDRSFVVNVAECRNSRKIIQAIVMVAEAIGADVVAEGIESRRQFEWIRELGCHRAQGYFLCEPMSATTFPDVVLGGS